MVAMYSLELLCTPDEVDELSAELWERGTAGIREIELAQNEVRLIAGFDAGALGEALVAGFAAHQPRWYEEPDTDWVAHSERAWPGRLVGSKFFLCAPWCEEQTPAGRERLVHNPGLACGTGEHPCTRLAIEALEMLVKPGMSVADIGTGSGILAVAALRLGAGRALGFDPNETALHAAQNNLELNRVRAFLVAGYAHAVAPGWADITVANISGTVLTAIMDELVRITKPGGAMVLSGFMEDELPSMESLAGRGEILSSEEWRCLIVRIPDPFVETAQQNGTSLLSEE
jgi:ribosomal protein L11 methyltransferase